VTSVSTLSTPKDNHPGKSRTRLEKMGKLLSNFSWPLPR
jgi:hypothetical protein